MSDMPTPTTLNAVLMSAGNHKPTPHVYDHAEEVPFENERGKPNGSVLAFVFKCTVTGALRRWGNFEEAPHVV